MMIGLIVHLIIFLMFKHSNLYLFHIGFETKKTTIKSFYCFSTLNLVFTNIINYKNISSLLLSCHIGAELGWRL